MKVRWRQHEATLVIILFIIPGVAYLRDLYNTDRSQYASPFINNNVPFNLYKNVVLPDVSMGVLICGAYCQKRLYASAFSFAPKS